MALEFAILLGVYFAVLHAMAKWRVMEQILSPNPGRGRLFLSLAFFFLLLRFFVILVAPGLLLARVYFRLSDKKTPPAE